MPTQPSASISFLLEGQTQPAHAEMTTHYIAVYKNETEKYIARLRALKKINHLYNMYNSVNKYSQPPQRIFPLMVKKNNFIAFLCSLIFLHACNKPAPLFEQISSLHSKIDFSNTLEKHKAFDILYYLYYYNGGGVSVGDINNDGLPDIYFTASNHGGNKLYLNKGNFEFEDITNKAGVAGTADWCTGSTMADVNGDGFLDIYVCAVQGEHNLKRQK